MDWTQEQRLAIEARGNNILLSAAAGSGKTTVLVARVLALITGGETEIDRLLIVTFTRAAAADMRAKLARELGRRAAEGDDRCRRSQLLLERASISTLHGFCAEFLRAHFEAAGVDPAFRVLDGAETHRLMDEALDEALEEAYQASDAALLELDYGRGPKGVATMAQALLEVLDERPDPQAWLDAVLDSDDLPARWLDELRRGAHRCIERALLLTRQAVDCPDAPDNCVAALLQDVDALETMTAIQDLEALRSAILSFKQATPARVRGMAMGDEVKKLRGDAKGALEKAVLRNVDVAVALRDVEALRPQLRRLAQIALAAREKCAARKAELAALSYTDLEHRTLAALRSEAVAQEMRAQYDFVFVDEYQDTSDVQEALVSQLARADNRFMVGDVKQSIYRFRQAEPSLFLDKYARYTAGEGGMLLPLTMNFRSRPGILNFVNHVFRRAMCGGDSEIEYDARAQLNHGNQALTGGEVLIHLIEAPDAETDEEAAEMRACEREAALIAARIRALMEAEPTLRYRDFAVLTRTRRGVLGRMAAVLTQAGIPAFAEGTEGYFDSVEITLALSLLRLTVNRRSDVELIGALRSPMQNFTAEELAQIRIACPDTPFVDACMACTAGEGELAGRLRAFFEQLDAWYLLSMSLGLGQLCRRVVNESGLYDCAGALPGGAQRQGNLDQLCLNADRFDQNVSGALTRFLKHCEKLRARGDGDDAPALADSEDAVRLMTAHKSKGLEFPVVFGAMLSRRYNVRSMTAPLTAHRELGLGCLYCDPTLRSRRKTLPQLAIAERVHREESAEELRVLYVLLTRARDRLELVGSIREYEKAQLRWRAMLETPGAATSYLDVIMPALENAPEGLCSVEVHRAADYLNLSRDDAEADDLLDTPPAAEDDALLRALAWRYPDAEAAREPLKLTVTGLLRELQGPEAAEEMIERPSFMAETPARMTGTERGTAYHRAMQLLELAPLRALGVRDCTRAITDQLDAFAAGGRMEEAQRAAVSPAAIARFCCGDTGSRLLAADTVRREWPFNVMMRMSEALLPEEQGAQAEREILVQGAIDCCFVENGKWVLLDYKTDRNTDAEALTARYRSQLRLYALALERITGLPVADIRLCLLLGGEEISISGDADAD